MTTAVTSVQRTAQILGAIILLVGIIGFFNNPVLGAFSVNLLHNLVHLITGAVLLWAGFASNDASVGSFKTFGIIYAIVTIIGFLGIAAFNDLLMINGADNVLHLILAIVFLAVGFGMAGNRAATHA